MLLLLTILTACAHHPSYPSYEKPKNITSVLFVIEDANGQPYDVSTVDERWEARWEHVGFEWTDRGFTEYHRSLGTSFQSVTVAGQEVHLSMYGGGHLSGRELPPTGQLTWLRIEGKKGKRQVEFPKTIWTPDRLYEVVDNVRTVFFVDGAVEHLVLKPLPTVTVSRATDSASSGAGHFVLRSDTTDVELNRAGVLKLEPEDLGSYQVAWAPYEPDSHYEMVCSTVIREDSVPAGISTAELCRNGRGGTYSDCLCDLATNADSELHLAVEGGVIKRWIVHKDMVPVPPDDLALVIDGKRAKAGDTVELTYGHDLKVTVMATHDLLSYDPKTSR